LLAHKRGLALSAAVEQVFSAEGVAGRDRRLAEELAYGSVRHRLSLDLVLGRVSSRPLAGVHAAALEAMRQALYQALYLQRVPEHAAVNEAVQLTGHLAGRKVAGFANAVLRAALRLRAGRGGGAEAARAPRSALSFRGGEAVLLNQELLPDPQRDRAGWLSAHFSYPRWLVERLLQQFGEASARRILAWGNEVPPLSARINRLRVATPVPAESGAEGELVRRDGAFAGCSRAIRGELPGAWLIQAEGDVAELAGFRRGLFSIQDQTQQRVALALAPRPGERVLDLCAAPGGKTMHLAELSGDRATILACDPDARRLALVEQAARRLGAGCVRTRQLRVPPLPTEMEGAFEAVLVDVPCSNTGAMNRRVEARWKACPRRVESLTGLQAEVLAAGLTATGPGGRLVYSTCSLLQEENRLVVDGVLAARARGRLIREELTLPVAGRCDGGYLALLEA
jgi:16S rRNA (cytosine967-C5)-methyltransferase